jgi:hypothetical protein
MTASDEDELRRHGWPPTPAVTFSVDLAGDAMTPLRFIAIGVMVARGARNGRESGARMRTRSVPVVDG